MQQCNNGTVAFVSMLATDLNPGQGGGGVGKTTGAVLPCCCLQVWKQQQCNVC